MQLQNQNDFEVAFLLVLRIVGRFLANGNIVRMALNQARISNANEFGTSTKFFHRSFTTIAHTRAKSALHLINNIFSKCGQKLWKFIEVAIFP